MAGGRYNSITEAGYTPVEGELLGIASALHKTRYFISGHPKVTVITDHKPNLNLLQDRTKTINNKRLTNLRRKCDGFIFKTLYGKGIDNTSDAISRIEDWSKTDQDRFGTVNDHTEVDDDSIGINNVEVLIKNDFEDAIFEVNSLAIVSETERSANIDGALSNSWHTTPKKEQLRILIDMFAGGD